MRNAPPSPGDKFLYVVDSLSAFALPSNLPPDATVNWSKTPFSLLERNGRLPFTTGERILRRFERYCSETASLGFNAITVDDVAHFAAFEWYPDRLKEKIEGYARLFVRICDIADGAGMELFVTTDANFSTGLRQGRFASDATMIARACSMLLERFPQVSGVVLRIGECDGLDVDNEMRSNLSVRTPAQARLLITRLLPLFERHGATLIARTWTVGAFPVGDLIWNPATYHAVFDGITSHSLIVSHKYGVTDFFRYLSLNPLIFEGTQRKLVEFQARREYEGFGEFPSFVGDYYESLRKELTRCESLAGIMVWSQTGGWSRFRSLTFMPGSSMYNEINTAVTVSLFAKGDGVEAAVFRFCQMRAPHLNAAKLLRLLRLSSEVIESLWYIPEFSQHSIFFRRTRVPPLVWVFWDTIVISATLRLLVRRFASDKEATDPAPDAMAKIDHMLSLAAEMNLDQQPFILMRRTMQLLGLARAYFFGDFSPDLVARILEDVAAYQKDFPRARRFSVVCDFRSPYGETAVLWLMFRMLPRKSPSYRLTDRLLFNRLAALVVPFVKAWNRRRLPAFVRERGMGFESLLR
jgi:hypothetical protein